MDPDQLLENIFHEIETAEGDDANRLGELFMSMHEWLSNGGFLPKAWERKENA